jgi:PAS domain S-box-containing protein
VEQAADGIAIADLEGNILYVNPAWAAMHGYTVEELEHAQMSVFHTAEQMERDVTPFNAIVLTEGLNQGEVGHVRKDGAQFPTQMTTTLLRDGYGEPIGLVGTARDITADKAAEQALKESETKFRNIIDSMPLGMHMYTLEPDGRLIFSGANRAADEILGIDNSQFVGKTIEEAFPPMADTEIPVRYRQAAAEGEPWMTEQVSYEDEQISGAFEVYAFQTAPGRMVAAFLEVTDRLKAREELRRERDLVSRINETSPVGITVLDRTGRIIFANPYVIERMNLSQDEATQRYYNAPEWHITDYAGNPFPQENLPFPRVMQTREAVYDVRHAVELGGERLLLTVNAAPLFDEEGEIDAVVTVVQDITEQVEAEARVLQLQYLLQNITDSMPLAMVTLDPEGRVLLWNPAAEALTGVNAEQVHDKIVWQAYPQFERYQDLFEQVLRERRVVHLNREALVTAEGEVYRDVSAFSLMANGVEGVGLCLDDVTERVRLEEMMLQSAKMASVGGLAAGVAHEINNPLGVIMQCAQMLHISLDATRERTRQSLRRHRVDVEGLAAYLEERGVDEYVEGIRSTSERAAKIVADLLSFSRKSSSKTAPCDLGQLVERTIDLAAADYDLKRKYDFKRIEIVREFSPGLPPVVCDEQQIQQVVLNLVRNSAQAMAQDRQGGVQPRLTLRTSAQGEWVRLEVEDNGPGVPEELRLRLFEPFVTTKVVGEGTGLGLWLCWSIVVERHRGRIWAEDADGGGTRFVVELPLRQ